MADSLVIIDGFLLLGRQSSLSGFISKYLHLRPVFRAEFQREHRSSNIFAQARFVRLL